jgi:hypothetical protein
MKFTPNLVVGVIITLVGSVLVLDRLGLVEVQQALRLWPIMLTLFGVSVIVQALRDDREGSPESRRPIVSPGLVLLVAALSFFGWRAGQPSENGKASSADRNLSLVAVFAGDERVSTSDDFGGARMVSVFGATKLDLRQAKMTAGGEAVIELVAVFGGVEITVPPGWDVDVRAAKVMAGINDRRSRAPGRTQPAPADSAASPAPAEGSAPRPRLVVRGAVVFGGVEIKS